MNETPSMDDLKEIAGGKADLIVVDDTPQETIKKSDTIVETIDCERVLEIKKVKKNGQYHIKTVQYPNSPKPITEIMGMCPTCGEMFMGKVEESNKLLPCINEDCTTKFKYNDRTLVGCKTEEL